MTIQLTENWIYFNCSESQARRLDAVYLKSKKCYRVPNNLHAMRELWQEGIKTPELAEAGKRRNAELEKILSIKNSEITIGEPKLRPYQQTDIAFLLGVKHVGIFNQQRTGKTPTALKLIEHEGFSKGIIVCPASLVYNWQKELTKWTTLTSLVVKGEKRERTKLYQQYSQTNTVLIISYDTLKLDVEHLTIPTGFILLDEAHYICNHKTARAKACYQLGRYAQKRIALTGTPSKNKGVEVYGILKFLYPEQFPGYWQFVDRYFKTWHSPWGTKEIGKPKRPDELQEILNTISVQRKRAEVMGWIPPRTEETIILDMEKKQEKLYKSMLKDFIAGDIDAPSVLSQLTRLRQIALAPSMLNLDAPSVKEEWLKEYLQNAEFPFIVFSNFSTYLRKLAEELHVPIIDGKTPISERQKIVNRFQAEKINVVFANIEAAGTGLTLDRAEVVVFLDRHFSPIMNEQAEDRIVPTTKEANQKVHVIDLVCRNTVDEKIHDLLEKKENIIKLVNSYKSLKEFL